MSEAVELVTLTIDGNEVRVPKGTNLVEAALTVGVEIPFYCYHRHLSVAGNCRMCQVKVEGAPKLTIGCNTGAQEGMVVYTQKTSPEVEEAQRATLEFLLINHPLDCTVCDQAGHCKLQDYYYEYNKKASRFIEQKVGKVKAEVFGPEVVYDGERCIVCTRCVRFCDEVTETGELSVLNRGDRTVIAINEDVPLDNPFCPVGALTHRRWRFNSRIWYSGIEDSICTGCSTGCNVRVAVRDDTVVQVKGRLNSEVNKEWMCDEGRYGFERFQPKVRLSSPLVRDEEYLEEKGWKEAFDALSGFRKKSPSEAAILISPFLTLEEMWVSFSFAKKVLGIEANAHSQIAVALRRRKVSDLEKILVSPDYAPNARGAQLFGYLSDMSDWRASFESQYDRLLEQIRAGVIKKLVLVGFNSLLDEDLDETLIKQILQIPDSLAITPRGVIGDESADMGTLGAHQLCKVILPSQTVHEKSGVMANKELRIQKLTRLFAPPVGATPDWMLLQRVASSLGISVIPDSVRDERALFQEFVSNTSVLGNLTLRNVGSLGIDLRGIDLGDCAMETSKVDEAAGNRAEAGV
jgi:NADH-quinone oxidoreductase subunit G